VKSKKRTARAARKGGKKVHARVEFVKDRLGHVTKGTIKELYEKRGRGGRAVEILRKWRLAGLRATKISHSICADAGRREDSLSSSEVWGGEVLREVSPTPGKKGEETTAVGAVNQ